MKNETINAIEENSKRAEYEEYYLKEKNKTQIKDILRDLEYNYFRVDKIEFSRLINKTLHPHTQERLVIALLRSIADYEGYYPLLVNDIAKTFKHWERL